MRTGQLDTLITIQRKVVMQDPTWGSEVVTWEDLGDVWANVQDVMPSRDEGVMGGSLEVSQRRTRVRIRWRSDVDSSMRILVTHPRARTLQIIGGPADIGGRRRFIELMCEEISTE